MKKQKLNLKQINVRSFITGSQVRGGSNITCHPTNCLNTGTVTGPGPTGNTCGDTCNNACNTTNCPPGTNTCNNCGTGTGGTGGGTGGTCNLESVRICPEGG